MTSLRASGTRWALRLLGEIASQRDPPDADSAETHYRQALILATDVGMRPLITHCHLGLGRLYGRIGRQEQAQESLGTATRLYREMDMAFWAEKAEAESRPLHRTGPGTSRIPTGLPAGLAENRG